MKNTVILQDPNKQTNKMYVSLIINNTEQQQQKETKKFVAFCQGKEKRVAKVRTSTT